MADKMSQTDVESYFLETGVIIDGLKPFTPESFQLRSRNLLLMASRFAIINFARWVSLGGVERAASLVKTLTAKELAYFERKKMLHVFADVFPVMNMEAVLEASLMISSMKALLEMIGNPLGKYQFTWNIIDTFPMAFLADYNYAGALIHVVCTKLQFGMLTQDTLDRLHKIHGKGCPARHAWWVALSREVIVEEIDSKVEMVVSEIYGLVDEAPLEARAIIQENISSKLAKIESLRTVFLDSCFELELTPPTLQSERLKELRGGLTLLRSAIDDLTTVYTFLLKQSGL